MHRNVLVVVLLLAAVAAGCRRKADDGTDPTGGEALPALELRDETPELLLTWIDGKGDTHTAVRIADVPMEGRNPVRVIARDAGQGQLFYVADLTLKQGDGSYAVRTMPRGEWESLLEARRVKARPPELGPPPSAEAPSARSDAPSAPDARSAAYAIIYGAEWCGPCHQAKDYLERRGVPVTFHDIEKDPKRASEMKRKLREAKRSDGNIPVIDLGGKLFVGFNPRALDRAIAQAKPTGGTPI
ncbi:MAG: glutaredoxin family protein [Deltaproteobacteria bacterium]|nr:glutaredoxin family protein [Deltaproteobacteria bacterium]